MNTKPFILIFPVDANRNEVENLTGGTYTKGQIEKIIVDAHDNGFEVIYIDLDEFVNGVNNQDFDILSESWITYVNIIK